MTGLTKWLLERPPTTIERLKKINHAASSSAHIILALSYGLQDPNIGAVNKIIVTLLLARHRAQRCGNLATEQRIEGKLQDLHEAINYVTDTPEPSPETKYKAGNACKKAPTIHRRAS